MGKADRQTQAAHTIDGSGLILTPGFIDPHTHSLSELLDPHKNANLNYRTQGVTTVLVGNDGGGDYQITKLAKRLKQNGIGTNVGLLVGHNSIRKAVLGNAAKQPTPQQLTAMKNLLRQAMEQGAIGFSSGLYYVPGSYSQTTEVIELAKIAAEFDSIYESHIRDEGNFSIGFIAALKEFIQIIKAAKIDGHIAHIKALGVDNWGQSKTAINLIQQAKQQGLNITADQYPWQASGTFLHSALMPKWAMEGSRQQMIKRLQDPKLKTKITAQVNENLRKRGGADSILITASKNPQWQAKRLSQIATANQLTAAETAIQMVTQEAIRIASFNMSMQDIEGFMQQPWVVSSSDGTDGHPRKYASFPQKYQKFVNQKNTISLAQFINRSSAKTASIFKLKKRGTIKLGYAADLNLIKLQDYRGHADFSHWNQLSTGIIYQFINGQPGIINQQPQAQLNGQVLLRTNYPKP